MNSIILEFNGLSVPMLEKLSYASKLGLSLKKTLRHFDSQKLLDELFEMADWLDTQAVLSQVAIDYRIKSFESIRSKYIRHAEENRPVSKIFNDILGFRAFCDDYAFLKDIDVPTFRVADLSHGKGDDDGYRGVHLYFQLDNLHYPIEIQYNTLYDRQINNWLHEYIYKKGYPNRVGCCMREYYERGDIRNVEEFREVLIHVLSNC